MLLGDLPFTPRVSSSSSRITPPRNGKRRRTELRKRESTRKRERDEHKKGLAAACSSLPAGFRVFAYFRAFAVPSRSPLSRTLALSQLLREPIRAPGLDPRGR